MRCAHCNDLIASCIICGRNFNAGQRIKCVSADPPFEARRTHSHLDCGLHIVSSKVIE